MHSISFQLPESRLVLQGFQSNPEASKHVLALHGWLDNCYSFIPLARCLPEYNFIAIDLPGHGDSTAIPQGTTYDFHCYLLWLQELFEVLGKPPQVLLGHSMGAVIAGLYAGVFAERIPELILIEALGPLSVPDHEAPQKMRAYIQGWMLQKNLRNSIYSTWEQAVTARANNGPLDFSSAELLAQRGAEPVPQGVRWKHDPRHKMPSRYQFSEAQTLAYLSAITAPTLFIEAEQTIIPKTPSVQRRRDAIKSLQAMKLPGGHHLHMDQPEPVAMAIRQFLSKESL